MRSPGLDWTLPMPEITRGVMTFEKTPYYMASEVYIFEYYMVPPLPLNLPTTTTTTTTTTANNDSTTNAPNLAYRIPP